MLFRLELDQLKLGVGGRFWQLHLHKSRLVLGCSLLNMFTVIDVSVFAWFCFISFAIVLYNCKHILKEDMLKIPCCRQWPCMAVKGTFQLK